MTVELTTYHESDTIGQDSGKGRSHASKKVENGISLLDIISCVPSGYQVYRRREEARLESTNDHADTYHVGPFFDKARR